MVGGLRRGAGGGVVSGFLSPVRLGDVSVARDSKGVCSVCDERVERGEEVRFETRALGHGSYARGFTPARKPKWVHAACFQEGGHTYVKQRRKFP